MLVTLEQARAHLRVDAGYPAEQIEIYLRAAEQVVQQYLGRRLFETAAALSSAIDAVPVNLQAASAAFEAAMTAANAIEDEVARAMARDNACLRHRSAGRLGRETYEGIAMDDANAGDAIRAGILLTLGHLYENRQDVVIGATGIELPLGARAMLFPWRAGLGV